MTLSDQQSAAAELSAVQSQWSQAVREHWKAFLVEGIILVILGLIALLVPPVASVVATIFLGWLFVATGVAGLAMSIWARHMPGLWWSVVSAALAIAAGLILLIWPLEGTFSLTIIVGAYFLVEGIATIMFALDHKRELTGRWGWMLFAGILDILVSAVITIGLPGSSFWAVGLIIGLNLMFGGLSLIGMALAARSASASPTKPV